jgi:putative membrane protein
MKWLSEQDTAEIAAAIKKAEETTSGEIVFATADASARYQHANFQGALIAMAVATAVYLALPRAHSIPGVLWTEVIAFALFYAIAPYLPWRRRLISRQEMDNRVREAALAHFYASGLYRTRDANGVLIYLSRLEHRVVVLGDRGINEKVGEGEWQHVRDTIIDGIRNGAPKDGICAAIAGCAQTLAQHFPRKPDDTDEISNQVIDRRISPDAP